MSIPTTTCLSNLIMTDIMTDGPLSTPSHMIISRWTLRPSPRASRAAS